MDFEILPRFDRVSNSSTAAFRRVLTFRPLVDDLDHGHANVSRKATKSGVGALKRLMDVTLAISLLVLFAPLFLVLALAIMVQRDGGQVIFKQMRIGFAGEKFPCLKFRSMCHNADQKLSEILKNDATARAEWEATHKLLKDPRVTKIGSFLRATSLDELPQLWNVIRGDMSLVGPRPITLVELNGPYVVFNGREDYLSVRPGLTGLWQVSGRSLVSYSNRVELDKKYVQTQSLVNDFKILFRTVFIVLLRHGAA